MSATSRTSFFLLAAVVVLVFASPASAFGAGNIASIAKIEGHNYRHGDIEDTLQKIAFLKGAKWTSKQIRRVYFGNWLRDYSQALDVGTLKSVPKDTIRCLVWVLSFLGFGYATGEFEVTEERLGVYRPEEHIDNPKNYADDKDAQVYDKRLRPPVHPHELAIDPLTGMKNYIANETGGWATSSGYVKFSITRSVHYGRLYTSGGPDDRGNEMHLCEALRCLGQALHCMEDFSAHSNYVELVLREMGFRSVFPHCGTATEMEIGVLPGHPGGRRAFPIVTGTFGSVDFAHSVLGEAQDKFSQTEVDEMDNVLAEAHEEQKRSERSGQGSILKDLLGQMSSTGLLGGDTSRDIEQLERDSDAQEMQNMQISNNNNPAHNPLDTIRRIYPILEFRDRIMHAIENAIEKIPGLTALVEKISDTLSLFVLSLLAPFIRPIIARASLELKQGSSAVVDSSGAHQYEPWTDPNCTDPTHSLLSKDHFSNKLNTPAGEVASAVLGFVVPRILHAWEDTSFPTEVVLNDCIRVFHHPALRDPNSDIQSGMFNTVATWVEQQPNRGANLNNVLSAEAVRAGKNHSSGVFAGGHGGGHGKPNGGEWDKKGKSKKSKKSKYESGDLNIGGVQLPGPVGGLVGGILDAGVAGFIDPPGKPAGYGDKKDKKKDKHKERDQDYGKHERKNKGDYKEYKDSDKKDKKDKYKDMAYHEKDRKEYREKDHKEYREKDHKEYREKDRKEYREKDRKEYREKDHKEYKEKDRKDKDKKEKKHKSSGSGGGGGGSGGSYSYEDSDYEYRHQHSRPRSRSRSRERRRSRSRDHRQHSHRDYNRHHDYGHPGTQSYGGAPAAGYYDPLPVAADPTVPGAWEGDYELPHHSEYESGNSHNSSHDQGYYGPTEHSSGYYESDGRYY